MRFIILSFLNLVFITTLTSASLNHMYKINEFKIFYTLTGKDKLPYKYQIDKDNNSVPDYIESIGTQLNRASIIFKELGFINPLNSQRYKNKASFISVSVKSLKNNGIAFDGISNSYLSIHISNNLSPYSLTPLHEYFHLIQNGYTMFKNRWFTEGTARWSEFLFRETKGNRSELPSTIEQLNKDFLNQTYDADVYWNQMAYLCGKKNINQIYGYDFMRQILEDLEKADKKVSQNRNYNKYQWKEKNQKSIDNNQYMICSIKNTLLNSCGTLNEELKIFINVLNQYTNYKCK